MGLDHGPPNFCQKVWFLIMGTMVIIPIWVLIMYPVIGESKLIPRDGVRLKEWIDCELDENQFPIYER